MKRIFLAVLFAVLGVIIAGSVFSLIGSYVLDLAGGRRVATIASGALIGLGGGAVFGFRLGAPYPA